MMLILNYVGSLIANGMQYFHDVQIIKTVCLCDDTFYSDDIQIVAIVCLTYFIVED